MFWVSVHFLLFSQPGQVQHAILKLCRTLFLFFKPHPPDPQAGGIEKGGWLQSQFPQELKQVPSASQPSPCLCPCVAKECVGAPLGVLIPHAGLLCSALQAGKGGELVRVPTVSVGLARTGATGGGSLTTSGIATSPMSSYLLTPPA